MFRAAPIVTEPGLQKLSRFGMVIFGASDGAVYVGAGDGIYRIRPHGRAEPVVEQFPEVRAICEGPAGTIWIFLDGRFIELHGNAATAHPYPAAREEGIQNCAVDGRNTLWANGQGAGLFHWESGSWIRREAGGPGATAQWLAADSHGHLMLFLSSGELVRVDRDGRAVKVLFRTQGIVNSLYQGRGGFYVGGAFGLVRVRGDGVQILSSRRFSWLRDVSSMVETPAGEMWMAARTGIVEIGIPELERAFSNATIQLHPTVLSFADGLPDTINGMGDRVGAARGGDGRIWIATTGGVVWIDPSRLPRNPLPPPVVIRALRADTVRHANAAQLALPAGVSNVAIEYSAPSLSIPERVHFRYRLDGFDRGWVDGSGRREAFYTNLPPGNYKFHVTAANGAGIWNRNDAIVAFTIAPTFLQSIWFKMLVILVLAGLAWLAYVLRVRQVTARLQDNFNVRIAERERIARELHDTLLQGCQGLVLQFQAIANRVSTDDALRSSIEHGLDRADAILAEGRARVRELRSGVATSDLAQALAVAASNIIVGAAPRFHFTLEGKQRPLNTLAGEEISRIFEEAIRNVVEHAHAENIHALLVYDSQSLRLSIRDDGIGMATSKPSNDGATSHFGLIGMRERAERIGGHLEVTSRQGKGTEIIMSVSAHAAYEGRRMRAFDRLRAAQQRAST
jgi:signal transduction histidine kinase